jgi:pyrroline-5-carboxylate reductase
MIMNYAVLGAGKMGSALVRGMIASGLSTGDRITISAKTPDSAKAKASSLGVNHADSNEDAIRHAEIVFLCVKPAQATAVVSSVASELDGKLLISIVAAIPCEDLFQASGGRARVIRSMPNTAVRLRKGITALSRHHSCNDQDMKTATAIFSSVGSALIVREEDLDTVTAVSGSGPAFALLMLEAMAQGGVDGGLDPEMAKIFAAGALAAAASLVIETGETPLALRDDITSPAGTTASGLEVLNKEGFPRIVRDSVRAARARSIELSKPRQNP